jgi:hypothetical protein
VFGFDITSYISKWCGGKANRKLCAANGGNGTQDLPAIHCDCPIDQASAQICLVGSRPLFAGSPSSGAVGIFQRSQPAAPCQWNYGERIRASCADPSLRNWHFRYSAFLYFGRVLSLCAPASLAHQPLTLKLKRSASGVQRLTTQSSTDSTNGISPPVASVNYVL